VFPTDLFETGSKHGLGSEEYSGFTKSPAEQKEGVNSNENGYRGDGFLANLSEVKTSGEQEAVVSSTSSSSTKREAGLSLVTLSET